MAQNFPSIAATDSIKDSRVPLTQRDDAAASNFSGTAFPTTGLLVGMLCHRTDLDKIYSLKDLTPTWVEVFDVSGTTGLVPRATQLATNRSFSITGTDVTATGVNFNGTSAVALNAVLTNTGVTAGTYCKVTVNAKGRVTVGASLANADLPQAIDVNSLFLKLAGNIVLDTHGFQNGLSSGLNIAMDATRIQARNNGAPSAISINSQGGNVGLGDETSNVILGGTISGGAIATVAIAEAGAANDKIMTPVRVKNYVDARRATLAEAQGGTESTTLMTPLRTAQAIPSVLNASGAAPLYACRAWVNFNGTGTPAIKASGNVSSVTDLGTGTYRLNFATALQDANYAVAGMCSSTNDANPLGFVAVSTNASGGPVKATTSVTVDTGQTNAATWRDYQDVSVAIFR